MVTNLYPIMMIMMMIWVSWTSMTMTKLVTFYGFSTLALADWMTVITFNFVDKQIMDLEALNESLRDLLDGIQVSWI